jgi:hypothetical protein
MVGEAPQVFGEIRHEQPRKRIDQPDPDQGKFAATDVPQQGPDLPGVGDEGARSLAQQNTADGKTERSDVAIEGWR